LKRAVFGLAVLAAWSLAGTARAGDCVRPTDAGGFAGYDYGTATQHHFDTDHVRIWYVVDGPHAVRTASTRSDGVPDEVALSGSVTEDALAKYGQMGFRALPSDADPTCGSNGGDGRFDVYLVAFASADGTTSTERCTPGPPRVCASFILAEAKFGAPYASAEEGIRTVLPHETFHAVQNAYDADLERFWAEGTAQWAAKTLDPALGDLERFLPDFFANAAHPFDSPPGGAVAGFLYGAAIWPVYLTTRFGAGIVQSILEEEGKAGAETLDATDTVLKAAGSGLGAEYARFAAWNAATATRAAAGVGYADAAKYPLMKTTELADGTHGATSGLASMYYHLASGSDARAAAVTADATRTTVTLVPIEGGAARVDKAVMLSATPTRMDGEAIAVVSGITTAKTDADYTLSWTAVAPGPTAHGGCSVGVGEEKPSPASVGGVAALTGLTAIGALLRRLKGRARARPPEAA
jgi:hypothetical protein